MDESHQEATEKEVERILGFLQAYYKEERKLMDFSILTVASLSFKYCYGG